VHELTVTTERKTQMIEITAEVHRVLEQQDAQGSAVLVYVPHTTAGVTINEKIDPVLIGDLERAFGAVIGDDWEWKHEDADGPNASSHARASLASSPQVVIPLRDGVPALGRYQGIFFCEFDGPRTRSVYVQLLA
jgi:secondary thiamine-phosphate synthase enzyme